jgi:hypothetical protein
MKLFSLVFSIAIASVAYSQTAPYSNQLPWQTAPIVHTTATENKSSDAVYLNDARVIEYVLNEKEAYLNMSYYKLIKVQTDKGIEMYNKLYVPVFRNSEVLNLKARVILQSGKVIDFPSSKVKETEEDGRKYKLFALEGVEKNAEIEYSYTIKRVPTFFGTEVFQLTSSPVEKASIVIIGPEHLVFEAKGFNGITSQKDTLINKSRYVTAQTTMLKELSDAKYALVKPYQTRIDYKLSYNLSKNNDVELYTWKEFAKNIYTNNTTLVDKEKKYLDKIIKAMNFATDKADEATICKIEDYVKTNFNIDKELVGDNGMDIEKIYTTKNASDDGITRLFANIFETLGIKYQIVFPSTRNEFSLDEELENWNRVENTLIYFPQTGKFISPNDIAYRYPFVEPYNAGTRGLFLKGTVVGTLKTAVGVFNDIALEGIEKNKQNMEVEASFDNDLDSVTMQSKQILTGYAAANYRPIFVFMPKDKQDLTTKDILKSVGKSSNVIKMEVTNTALTDLTDNKPLIIAGTLRSGELLEKAGNKLLFKAGEIIGQQVEMYQDKPRVLPVDMPYPNTQDRNIKVTLPDGYTVKNLKDLDFDVQFKKDGVASCGFICTHSLTGNLLEIKINEFYNEIHYPLSDFENFKRVVNASADFNKVVLVLEKK